MLHGGRRFVCRCCVGVPYASQNEARHDRLLRRVQALRERLGGRAYAGLGMPFPPRPKRMRRATYRRLRAKAGRLGRALVLAVAERFRLTVAEAEDLF